ncbi:MAG: BolA family transcriptional regulator [Gammaproteobacteria bacterium]|nr:BolA family transcriptional regulator [Gammaproteobacteria bacterium]
MTERIERIRYTLEHAFQPAVLEIRDDSKKHIGHPGASDGRGHFKVTVISAAFVNKNLLERHKMIYTALGNLMDSDIHAISIDARTPDE